jgi:hypothetical protein
MIFPSATARLECAIFHPMKHLHATNVRFVCQQQVTAKTIAPNSMRASAVTVVVNVIVCVVDVVRIWRLQIVQTGA